jgi:hypothetical protein
LLGQVTGAESIGSPIAGANIEDINQALQTQRSAITGITNTAGDTVSSLKAVPPVSQLGDIFGGLVNTAGNLYAGYQAGNVLQQGAKGFAGQGGPTGTDPSKNSAKG